ncbi:hypothetical protein CAEBREN_07743 [Caenorhabditis brenneri]|uniref:Uncharacterized protein n=1 Tax=Caenorhabditis brenneri TaxID=135651 RepID=G0MUM5_CAEBE|nr:hypothetical protein CAEBREN_07743 [Caenorhabditis brenneri]
MVYAVVEILTQPIMIVHGSGWLIFADSFIKFPPSISQPLVSLYCASFGLCVSLLASHFVFRFVAICSPNDIRKLEGWNLLKMYIFPVIFSVVWFLMGVIPSKPIDVKSEIPVNETYGENTFELGYVGMLYYHPSNSGETIIRWADFMACFTCCIIMQTCITVMIVCGWKTYQKMGRLGSSMSIKTKDLNNQLFRALIIQTLVPILTMFTPVGLLLILPMFSIGVGTLANAPSLNAGIYPALDATIVTFMIRDFRETVICRRRGPKVSFSAATSEALYSVSAENHASGNLS